MGTPLSTVPLPPLWLTPLFAGAMGGFYKLGGDNGEKIGDLDLSETSNSCQVSPGG